MWRASELSTPEPKPKPKTTPPPSSSSSSTTDSSDSSEWSDVEPSCRCCQCLGDDLRDMLDEALAELECPFTWDTPPTLQHLIKDITTINKGRLIMPWNEVIIKTKLAYTFCKMGSVCRAPQYIAEAYMRLMPAFDEDDQLVREYGTALRHFVDATWAHVCRLKDDDDDDALRELVTFVAAVPSAKSLDARQRSALLIVRAKCEHYPHGVPLARKAIELNPDEGHWYSVLSKLMCTGRFIHSQLSESAMPPGYSVSEQLEAAVTGFQKRKTIESYLLLVRAHQDADNPSKALELMKKAVDAYPRSAWLLGEAAELATEMPKGLRDTRSALRWLQRALDCPGGQCPSVAYQLGLLLLELGEMKQARPHLERAAKHMDEAKELLKTVEEMRARAGPLPIHFMRCDGSSPVKIPGPLRAAAAAGFPLGMSVFRVGGGPCRPGPGRSGSGSGSGR
ncbi:Pre-mRNA-splicing factor SNU114 [Frankliniella fusca]|uniref:Pre-mRNA-splicing factor SNU114 n=1 Tax=Frankliniella fusca TaxID=407009 RepID=A0AAE1HW03_9NEOP|nr:Pre-mRNA-splicing factor SNU114 [Frankliniella fusca]